MLSAFTKSQREQAIQACRKLTYKIDKGLDLTDEIRAVLAQSLVSAAFHVAMGFDGVGQAAIHNGTKTVRYLEKNLR